MTHEAFASSPDLSSWLNPDGRLSSAKVTQSLLEILRTIPAVSVTTHQLKYDTNQTYQFIRAAHNFLPGDKIVAIGAELHASEIAGLITLLTEALSIFSYAADRKVKLLIYPLRNPSGLNRVCRYPDREDHCSNILGDTGSEGYGNGDFIRYRLADGSLVDDLGSSRAYVDWAWSSDIPGVRLPLETALMQQILRKDLAAIDRVGARIICVADLHQDMKTTIPGAYYYPLEDDQSPYLPVIDAIEKLGIPILTNYSTDAGFLNGKLMLTNHTGAIVRYDGSWPDLMSKLGVPYCVTTETTGSTPLGLAVKVNRLWINHLIDLAAASS